MVSAAVEQPVDRVLAAFDEAQEVGILRREPSRQFTHDLIRECAEADLPTARRAGIHRAAARYLTGRSDAAERVYEIANHHLAAIPAVDADEAMRWVLRAAGAAIDRLAWETAEALLTRVVAGGLDVSLLDRIEAYRLLAVARCCSFDLAGAEVALRSAVELAEVNSCGSEVLAGLLLTVEGSADPDWLPWLREAVRRVLARADHSTAVAARLTAELAFQEAFFDQQAAGVLSLRSSELADQSPDLAAQRASWRAQHFASSGPEGVRRRLELADRMEASTAVSSRRHRERPAAGGAPGDRRGRSLALPDRGQRTRRGGAHGRRAGTHRECAARLRWRRLLTPQTPTVPFPEI